MTSHNKKFRDVLLDIIMSIDTSLDLGEMLQSALGGFAGSLGLSGCAVFFYKVDEAGALVFEMISSFPAAFNEDIDRKAVIDSLLAGFRADDIKTLEDFFPVSYRDENGVRYFLYSLPYVGVLALIRDASDIRETEYDALIPLAEKLAAACTACLQRRELEMISEGTRVLNRDVDLSRRGLEATIREMRKTHDELVSSRNHLALILQSLGEGIIVADASMNVLMTNVRALEYLDVMPVENAVVTLGELFINCRGEGDIRPFMDVNNGVSDGQSFEITARGRHDHERQLRVVPNSIANILPGMPETIYLIQDISREKEIDRLKNNFISNLSHELRTPMNAILGISRMLIEKRSENLDERQRKGLSLINDSGMRLLALINDILDLSKIEAGKMAIMGKTFPLSLMFRRIAGIADNLPKNDVTFGIQTDDGLPDLVITDEYRLQQVIVNLIGNSFKFTEKGSVTLAARLNGNMLRFEVADTGIGIPEKNLPDIFDRFGQIDGSMSRRHQGTGIGLSLCKELVGLMGGLIHVESEEGRGTVIYFEIPFVPGSAGESGDKPVLSADSNPAYNGIKSDRRKKILVVDDEAGGRETLAFMLSDMYDCAYAENGPAAFEMFEQHRPDCVLMDIMMPGMDGYAVLDGIRGMEGGGDVSVIAVTARAMKGEREKILSHGFDGYISKPVDHDKLIAAIRNLIG